MKFALLIIDVQRAFFKDSPVAKQSLDLAAEYINAAIDLFRRRNLPIVAVQHMNAEDGLVPGTEGFEVSEKIQLQESDLRIHKTYGNSFNKTPLGETLRGLGVDAVLLTGFAAEGCVLATFHGARDLDLTPVILRGSLVSGRPEVIPCVESITDTVSYRLLRKLLA